MMIISDDVVPGILQALDIARHVIFKTTANDFTFGVTIAVLITILALISAFTINISYHDSPEGASGSWSRHPQRSMERGNLTAPRASPEPVPHRDVDMPEVSSDEATSTLHEKAFVCNYLCQDLIVPEGSECMFSVPRLPVVVSSQYGAGSAFLTVDDPIGRPVFHASIKYMGKRTHPTGRVLELTGIPGGPAFASCCQTASNQSVGGFALSIHNSSGVRFGELRMESNGVFCLATKHGSGIHCQSDGASPTMDITELDANGRLLAKVEAGPLEMPAEAKRAVTVGPGVDTGLIALFVLGMDWIWLEAGLE